MKLVSSYKFNDVTVILYYPKKFDSSKKYLSLIFNDGDFLDLNKIEIDAIVIGLTSTNRNDDYSPFETSKIDTGVTYFGGRGKEYNLWIVNFLLPFLEEKYHLDKDDFIYGGVSLGGLEAIYSLYLSNAFKGVFSICGSFWFPGFVHFARTHKKISAAKTIILNGEKEDSKSKNSIFFGSIEKAKEVASCLDASFYLDKYGHHSNLKERIAFVLNEFGIKTAI